MLARCSLAASSLAPYSFTFCLNGCMSVSGQRGLGCCSKRNALRATPQLPPRTEGRGRLAHNLTCARLNSSFNKVSAFDIMKWRPTTTLSGHPVGASHNSAGLIFLASYQKNTSQLARIITGLDRFSKERGITVLLINPMILSCKR